MPSVGSVAVTVIVAVSPGLASVVFKMTTPLGLVSDKRCRGDGQRVDRLRIFAGRRVFLNRDLGAMSVKRGLTGDELAEDGVIVAERRRPGRC